MMAPISSMGIPIPMCEGRALSKRDVGRWVVRTMPNNVGSDWSFTLRGSTIEDWKKQVVKVIGIRRAQVEVENKEGKRFLLDDEMSNDSGWLTLEEFIQREVKYMQMPFSTFINESKCLYASDVGKKFIRLNRNGFLDPNFIVSELTTPVIDLCAVEVLTVNPKRIAIRWDGREINLKDDYARADGWVEVSVFKEALKKQGLDL